MKLPGGERAVVDLAKVRDYCLSLDHPRGRHKARVFAAVLGFTSEHAEELRAAPLAAAGTEEATATDQDEYGQRYVVDFPSWDQADRHRSEAAGLSGRVRISPV
jgi:hypothetical protein